ncbi:MAG: hypothetical protein A2W00_10395 [Candidatus Eisenbacteria bacterium RBG_16_71_46]|nr:MAG: hypothetical protein A2W00_10395 [Candidatus Eisenbacteria bacterium RBG_16_71_46]
MRFPPWAVLLAAVALALIAWAILRLKPSPPRDVYAPVVPLAAMADSQRAALAAQDWRGALDWAARLRATQPGNVSLMIGLATAWHNVAWGGLGFGRARSACRNSLERFGLEQRSLALLDSAAALAGTREDWARAMMWQAKTYELEGFPIEALAHYLTVAARDSASVEARQRVRYIAARLRDPLLPN